ncbi:VOC family protein [Gordonia lacunae]|uniref:VOC family protein n=1 Tax=Gordonia lacunae TaxID=417102 RepID=UPI0039E3ECCD
MSMHRLTGTTIGVPDVATTASYYADFGLTPSSEESTDVARFSTQDGGEQLTLRRTDRRRLLEIGVGVDHLDDLHRVSASLSRLDIPSERGEFGVSAIDPGTGVRVNVTIAPRIESEPSPRAEVNAPGRYARRNSRAAAILREGPVRPRKLGHVVLGSTDFHATERFFIEGVGFKVSDRIADVAAFIRCSTDHHNVLIQKAPVSFLHHTSWIVDDVDEVGRGAMNMLAADPARHVWGLGRHAVGSNFFWYLKDPAGNFSEYSSDIDCIVDDALWKPEVWDGRRAVYDWGPPPPPSFLAPEDLADLMIGSHSG